MVAWTWVLSSSGAELGGTGPDRLEMLTLSFQVEALGCMMGPSTEKTAPTPASLWDIVEALGHGKGMLR